MQGKIIRSPEIWNKEDDNRPGIFLAGGIEDCPKWQADAAERIASCIPAVVVNPRQENSQTHSHIDSIIQMAWESKHLKKCQHIIFWFPQNNICPITLFELGAYLNQNVNLFIGTDLQYPRRLEVEVQMALSKPELILWSDLNQMIQQLISGWT